MGEEVDVRPAGPRIRVVGLFEEKVVSIGPIGVGLLASASGNTYIDQLSS